MEALAGLAAGEGRRGTRRGLMHRRRDRGELGRRRPPGDGRAAAAAAVAHGEALRVVAGRLDAGVHDDRFAGTWVAGT